MKWKGIVVAALSLLMVTMTIIGPVYEIYFHIPAEKVWTREYEAVAEECQGEVDIMEFIKIDNAFEIGANSEGVAVFKRPYLAFWTFKQLYADEIKLIQDEFDLPPMTQFTYYMYGNMGWQVPGHPEADVVTGFVDIYENSFEYSFYPW